MMASNDDLPAILVSAVDVATASEIITELISDSEEPPQSNGLGVHSGDADEDAAEGGAEARGVRWRLQTKYYSAAVRLLPRGDRPARAAPPADVQAHLIYLTEDECGDESVWSRRLEAARAAGAARGGVRLVAARGPAPPALAAWARARRYELVPLLGPDHPPEDPGDPPEATGVARLREALQAHVWPGLRPSLDRADSDSSGSSASSWGSWRRGGEGEGEAGAAERAEQFAGALALLGAAREARGDGDGEGERERRLRAEQLVAAFCRALGDPLPDLHQ